MYIFIVHKSSKMKNRLVTLLLVAIIAMASSCKKVEETTDQNITITSDAISTNIDPVSNITTNATLGTFTLPIDLGAKIQEKASLLGLKNLKSVKIQSVTIELLNGTPGNDFGNLESVEVEISADNQAAQFAARIANNTTTGNKLVVPANGNVELKTLVTGVNVSYRLKGKLRQAITKVLNAKVSAKYTLVVGI